MAQKNPRPGEISLAHNGVLFLDELPEYERHVLEGLREPLESGKITISRATQTSVFPARFQLIAAMNPCPCGNLTSKTNTCRCTQEQVQRYKNKISGPILDRIDMHLEVPCVPISALTDNSTNSSEPSKNILKRVNAARQIQLKRTNKVNALLSNKQILSHCKLTSELTGLFEKVIEKFGLSARAYYRVLKIARTIADLDNKQDIAKQHILEAIAFRKLDRA